MNWELNYSPTIQEQQAALRLVQRRLLRAACTDWRARLWPFAIGLLAGFAGFMAARHGAATSDPAWFFFLFGLIALLVTQRIHGAFLGRRIRNACIAGSPSIYTGPRRLRIDEAGVEFCWEGGRSTFAWTAVDALERCEAAHVLLASGHYLLLPGRAFDSPEREQACLAFIRSKLAARPTPSGQPIETRRGSVAIRPLLAMLVIGLRLALFRPVGAAAIGASPGLIGALVLCWIAIHLAADFAAVGTDGRWVWAGLSGLLFPIALILIASASIAAVSGRAERLPQLIVTLLATAVPIAALVALAASLLDRYADGGWAEFEPAIVAPAWLALASTVAISRLLDGGRRRALPLLLGIVLMLALPLQMVHRFDSLWVAQRDSDDYDSKYDALITEDAFYQQPKLLARALDGLAPQTPGLTDLYFIGVGGDAEQGVFAKEVRSVDKLMAQHFGAANRSITLINDYRGAMDYPVASVTALQRSLQRVGELMDKDDDILFLFLTSHGSQDHRFDLEFWPLQFAELNPTVLRRLLDEAGIRWRVIVVSACYSGGYIEPLRDEHTTVITAAAADKTSFGCSDENDWTYFGHAFFDQALRDHDDLEDAFVETARSIARREEEEGIDEASDPQIAAGAAMRAKWQAFLRQRAGIAVERTTAEPRHDRYDDWIAQLGVAGQLPDYRRDCHQIMAAYSPLQTLQKKPRYFGGLTPQSGQWPELIAHWERYVDAYCLAVDDPTYLALSAQAWRDSVSADELQRFSNWMASDVGKRFIDAQLRVENLLRRRLEQIRRPAIDEANDRFQTSVGRLVQAYQRQAQAKTDERPAKR